MFSSTLTNFDDKLNIWSGSDGVFPLNRKHGLGQLLLNELNKSPADYVIQINHNTGRKVTCSEMRLKANKFAEALSNMGIRNDDNITIICSHHDDLLSVVIGVSVIGCIINPLDVSFTINEMMHFLRMTQPKVVICDQNVEQRVEQSLLTLGQQSKIFVFGESKVNESIENLLIGFESTTFLPKEISDLDKTALIMCSSGTTGTPKGVLLSHLMTTNALRIWWFVISPCLTGIGNVKPGEVYFSPSNLFWLTCFGMICHSILHRCPRIIVESTKPVTPNVILDVLIQHKVNVTFLSPSIAMGILALLEASKGSTTLPYIRLLAAGGSFVSHELMQSMNRYIPNGKMFSCYGMTEVSGLIASGEVHTKGDSVGVLAPDMEISIVDDESHRLGPGESGEVCVRTRKYKIMGYLNNESENSKVFDAEKWFRTGDIGYFDNEGFLHLIDRKKEMLKYCNYQISPTELELCIQNHFPVDGVCVVGINDEKCGQLPAAVIVPKNAKATFNGDDVTKLIEDNFSDAKRLRGGVFFVSALPMTTSGKIQRKLVKEMISARSKN